MRARHNPQPIDGRPVPHPLRIHLLGEFRVEAGDRVINEDDWRLANAAALVKLLALAPGQRLHRDQLVEILWPDSPLAAAANSLRYALHVARRTLDPGQPPEQHPIRSRTGRLSLAAGAGVWIDVEAFERAAAVAERRADLGAYARALDFYAGDLLPGDRYEEWTLARRDDLRQRRLRLLRGLARLHMERGADDLALSVWEQVVEVEPLDEDAYVQLMALLGRLRLRHQALLQYERLREALARGLDAEPGPAARRIYRELRTGQAPSGETARRAGRAGKPGGEPETNLPAALTSFVGREAEIAALAQTILAQRLVSLTGSGGAGKTRLALEVAEGLGDRFPGGIWLVDLAGTRDPSAVPQQIASVLNVRDRPGQSLNDALRLRLRDRRALLIVDNCEHLLEACAALVYDLLRACPRLHILATSREHLNVPGEAVRQVRPLSFPEPGQIARSASYEAVKLFVERVRLVQPDFKLTPDTTPAVIEICRRLDGLPLAIELAAARMRTRSLEDIVARLASPLALLDEGSPLSAPRHRTMRAAIAWSFGLLTPAERRVARRLAVFRGGWTAEAASEIAACEVVPAPMVSAMLSGFVDMSLIKTVSDGVHSRYHFLETVHQYALEQLDQAGEAAATRQRHADYYLRVAEHGESRFRGPEQASWLAWWRAEQGNVRAALEFVIEAGRRQEGLHCCATVWRFWEAGGQLSEGRLWFAKVLDGDTLEAGELPRPETLRALFGDGRLAYAQGDYPHAAARFAASLRLARELGDEDFAAGSLVQLGHVAARQADYEAARQRYSEGLSIRRRQGDGWYLAVVLDSLGLVAMAEGDFAAARDYCEESLSLYRRSGDCAQIARSLALLAHLDYLTGDYPAALKLLSESLANSEAVDHKQGMALAYAGLGHVAEARGQAARSRQLFKRSRDLYARIGAERSVDNEIDALAWPPPA